MRVCMLTTSFPRFQGDYAGVFIFRFCRALSSLGVSVSVISPGDKGALPSEKMAGCNVYRFSYFIPKSWQVLAYGSGGIPSNLKKNPWLLFQIPFFLFAFIVKGYQVVKNADIVHAHWIYSGFIAWMLKEIHGTPFIVSLLGSDVRFAEKRLISRMLALWILKQATLITTVSQEFRTWAIEQGIPEDRVHRVLNGVDLSIRKAEENTSLKCRLLFVGNLVPEKGVRYLIEAMIKIFNSEKDVHLTFVGDGRERKKLQALVQKHGLDDAVDFVGAQSPDQVPIWMCQSDCLVLPSLAEGMPNVVLEAMACGLPVVASDLPGIREVVKEGETGFLLRTQDSNHLAEKLLEIVRNKPLRMRMGAKGRSLITEMELGWDQMAIRYQEVYQKVYDESVSVGRGRKKDA